MKNARRLGWRHGPAQALSALTALCALLSGCEASPAPDSVVEGPARYEPVVLSVRPAPSPQLGPFSLWDRRGEALRDLSAGLELDSSFAGVHVSVTGAGGAFVADARPPSWIGPRGWRKLPMYPRTYPGLAPRPAAALILVRAARSDGAVRLIGLDARGRRRFDHVVPGAWDALLPSPQGRYIFGDDAAGNGVVIDSVTGAALWTGSLTFGHFADDDRTFLFVRHGNEGPELTSMTLPDGVLRQEPGLEGAYGLPIPQASTPYGTVAADSGSQGTHALWLRAPDGGWARLSPPDEAGRGDLLLGFLHEGQVAVIERRELSSGSRRDVIAVDLLDRSLRRFGALEGTLAGAGLLALRQDALWTQALGEPSARPLRRLRPAAPGRALALGSVSMDGRVAVVSASWILNAPPPEFPRDAVQILEGDGEALLLPPGWVLLDASGALALLWPEDRASPSFQIGDVAARRVAEVPRSGPVNIDGLPYAEQATVLYDLGR